MNKRLKRLAAILDQKKVDALLVSAPVNIRYLTELEACDAWLLVCQRKAFYVTDARYASEVRRKLKGVAEVKEYKRSIYTQLSHLAEKNGVKRLGFDANYLTVAQHKMLKKAFGRGVRLRVVNGCVEVFREIKDPFEMEQIKAALKIHGQAHRMLKRILRPGLSERQILWKLDGFVKSKGAGLSFDPIIASGPNSCFPHAMVTDRQLRRDEPVLVDMGVDVNGYKSDLTRMFFLGRMPSLLRQVHDHVAEAQRRAIKTIKAGIPAARVDQAARSYLAQYRLARYFCHSLGHGVGLDIHESPRISKTNPAILKEGMVVTVEPAVYLPGQFGIRLEEMILVTANGCEILSDNIH